MSELDENVFLREGLFYTKSDQLFTGKLLGKRKAKVVNGKIEGKFVEFDENGNKIKNDIKVVSIEHKLGHNASPTCVLSFGENNECACCMLSLTFFSASLVRSSMHTISEKIISA